MSHRVKAVCQWEINEITIDIQGPPTLLFEEADKSRFKHGTVTKSQVCLNLEEAKQLVFDLQNSIANYEELERLVEEDLGK